MFSKSFPLLALLNFSGFLGLPSTTILWHFIHNVVRESFPAAVIRRLLSKQAKGPSERTEHNMPKIYVFRNYNLLSCQQFYQHHSCLSRFNNLKFILFVWLLLHKCIVQHDYMHTYACSGSVYIFTPSKMSMH